MKDYLKMSDWFDGEIVVVGSDVYIRFDGDGLSEVAEFHSEMDAKYSSHAINSHDELVEMNKELLAALEWSDSQIMEFICLAFRHAEIRGDFELSDVRDALNFIKSKAIAKTKGCAA